MQYLLLIYENEANRGSIDRPKMMEEYGKFTKSIVESGNFKGGDALQPTSAATTVRVKDGKPVTTHGPFAETREALIGYYAIKPRISIRRWRSRRACHRQRSARSRYARSWCTTNAGSHRRAGSGRGGSKFAAKFAIMSEATIMREALPEKNADRIELLFRNGAAAYWPR